MKNILTKILNITFLFILFLVFFAMYFYSLVIIKPRNITKIVNKSFSYLDTMDNGLSFNAETIMLEWNKQSFSFDFRLYNTNITINNNTLALPSILLDISKKNLLLGKLKLDNISIAQLDYNYQNKSIEQSLAFKVVYQDLLAKLNSLPSDIFKIGSVYIGKLNINDVSGNNLLKISKLSYETSFVKHKYHLLSSFNVGADSRVSLLCIMDQEPNLEHCDVNIYDFSTKKLKDKSNYFAKYSNILDANLKINKSENDKYNISFTTNINHKTNVNENIYLKLEGGLAQNIINLISSNITNFNKKIALSATYDLNKDFLSWSILGENLQKKDILFMWPNNIARQAKIWLEKALIYTELENFNIAGDINFQEKKILKFFKADFKVKNSSLKATDNLSLITNIDGTIRLLNKKLNINIVKAKLEDEIVNNIEIKIAELKKLDSELLIKSKLNLKTLNLINFLLKEKLATKQLSLLNSYFSNSKIKGDFILLYLVGGKRGIKDFQLDFKGNLIGSIKSFISANSNSDIILTKKLNSNSFKLAADLEDAEFFIENLAGTKKIGNKLKLDAIIYKDFNNLNFNNISMLGSNVDIQGEIMLKEGGFERVYFDKINFAGNIFSINLLNNGTNLKGKVAAQNLLLSDNIFVKKNQSTSFKNLKFDYELDKVGLISKNSYFSLKGVINCVELCDFIYGEGSYNEENNFIFKSDFKDGVRQIYLESSNLGGILSVNKISDKIVGGRLRLNGYFDEENSLNITIKIHDFYVKHKNSFKKMVELGLLKKENIDQISFEQGEINLVIKDNKDISLDESKFYGDLIGVTAEGTIDLKNDYLKIKGHVIPAYKLNNLFAVKDIPIIGKVLTGREQTGIISAKYDLTGSVTKPEFKLYPLSALLPNITRRLKDIFTKDFWLSDKNKKEIK